VYNNYRAGQFWVEIATKDTDALSMAWWAADEQSAIELEVFYCFEGQTSWQSMIVGDVDNIDYDLRGNTVSVTGRDLTGRLIDAKTADIYANLTSSEIITMLCNSLGKDANGQPILTPVVTPTTNVVGQYYAYDHVRIALGGFSRAITKWDLATYLAQNENFDLFVEGRSLYFQPKAQPTSPPYVVQWSRYGGMPWANVVSANPRRSLTIAKGVSVTVKSWNSGSAKRVVETAGTANDQGQTYVLYRPNLTIAQASQLAQQTLATITKHEKALEIDMPGELNLTPRMLLQLGGTGTAFDRRDHGATPAIRGFPPFSLV
jgi:hypothetical protein